jgi:hypothetical protein
MSYYNDHLKAVSRRWINKREESDLPADEFNRQARKTLKDYGWNDAEINKILKIRKEKVTK